MFRSSRRFMASVSPLKEFSVVFNDRSLNHMSAPFQRCMLDLSANLKDVYSASAVSIIPGGGTFAMEAVARQFIGSPSDRGVVLRNGWFSFRWSQIIEQGNLTSPENMLVLKATQQQGSRAFSPAPIDEAVQNIKDHRPTVVFAPHVETSAGMILPDEYVKALADAAHSVGALLVLDCIASGTAFVDMKATGVDVLISAPQKGWSASPCAGLVMMSPEAVARVDSTESSSFSINLRQWLDIMRKYEDGGHAYHATMPTDSLMVFRDALLEAKQLGFDALKDAQFELGSKVRKVLADAGFESVAAPGFEAPGVVVCYTDDPSIHNGSAFAAEGTQIAAGVPLRVDEPADFQTFRIGLFGLEKLTNIDGTVADFKKTIDNILMKKN